MLGKDLASEARKGREDLIDALSCFDEQQVLHEQAPDERASGNPAHDINDPKIPGGEATGTDEWAPLSLTVDELEQIVDGAPYPDPPQQCSSQVWRILGAVKTEFGKYVDDPVDDPVDLVDIMQTLVIRMNRYHPSRPESTALITSHGLEKLKAEFHQLWHVHRPWVMKVPAATAVEGDCSENAEIIDHRLRYLAKRIPMLKVIDTQPGNHQRVFFGALITVKNLAHGEEKRYQIVGSDETDVRANRISIDSPLARAALKKKLNDVFKVKLPGGWARFLIVRIDYIRCEPATPDLHRFNV